MSEREEIPYRLIRLRARGVSGDVYRARRLSDEKIVAVKVFHRKPEEDPDFVRAMIQSAFRAKEFTHPAAVRVYECVSAPGRLALATELVEGEVLARVLQRNTRLPEKTVLAVMKRTADLLAAASAAGLHHGRLSPAKMFVGGGGRLKVLGTGLYSRRNSGANAHPAGYTWPLHYVAAEVLDGAATSESSDVYSLGVIGYHLLTGGSPFACERVSSLKIEKVSPVEWPPEIARSTSPGLLMLIEQMSRPQREKRPGWSQVADEIQALLKPAGRPAPSPRVRQAVPEERTIDLEPSEEQPAAKESPFMLPVLLALLFLVAATGIVLKTALHQPPPGGEEVARAAPPREPRQDAQETSTQAGTPEKSAQTAEPAPAAPVPTPGETARSMLQTIEESEKDGSAPPAGLLAEYERLASEFPNTTAGIKARMAAARIRTDIEQEEQRLLADLKNRTDAAMSEFRIADAVTACEELKSSRPGLKGAREEKDRIVRMIPSLFSQLQATAELYAARGDYQSAIGCYTRVIDNFPQGEWQAKAAMAISRLQELDERRNAAEEAKRRKEAQKTSKTAYANALKSAWRSASEFNYSQARLALDNAFGPVEDTSLKRGLNLYREAIDHEEKFFEAVNKRLLAGERQVMLSVPGEEDTLLVAGISRKGVDLRTIGLTQMLYPWKRLSKYQHLRLFQMCMDESSASEWLGLATLAFHRKLYAEASGNLAKVTPLDKGRLADTAAALQTLFDEMRPLLLPERARNRRIPSISPPQTGE